MNKFLLSFVTMVVIFTETAHVAFGMSSLPKTQTTFRQISLLTDNPLVQNSNFTGFESAQPAKACPNTEFSYPLTQNKIDQSNGPLKTHRIVSYYGHPKSPQMGILGQLSPLDLVARLKKQAQVYSALDPCRPALPAIELIATVAGRTPGTSGLYYYETSMADIERYAKLAKANHMLLILDVQLGRDNILHQVKMLKSILKLPYVELAIDTEFHVDHGQIPGAQLGHVDGYEIQQAIQYVSDLTANLQLPDKVVVIHQFKDEIIRNKNAIKPTDHTELVLNFDGFGPPPTKIKGYRLLVKNQPVQYGGFKLFFRQDAPLIPPKDVLNLDPTPMFIDYQ